TRLGPKEKLDIPVLFMPDKMKMYEALVVIHVMRENGENWPYEDSTELNKDLKSVTVAENGGIQGILWIYPVRGIPEAPQRKLVPAVVRCRARQRVERRVEVQLTGVVTDASAMPTARNSATVNTNKPANTQEEAQVTDGSQFERQANLAFMSRLRHLEPGPIEALQEYRVLESFLPKNCEKLKSCFLTTMEFLYELQYKSDEIKSQLGALVGMHLVQKERDTESGIVTLIFNIVFAPNKPMRNEATLVVRCTTGGIWKFPVLFIATEPEVEDVINIEAVGLNKESIVGFKLTSQTRNPEPFTAHFLAGSDPEFLVLPKAGELLPAGTEGTHITVGFKPRMYGKKHTATLVIQTQSMQWMYEINGLPPQATAPPTRPAKVISTSNYIRSATVRQRNFLRENLKLVTTGVSSSIKGAPLILRTKQRKS
ncbi:PREDICTED: putative uncharacterized protein CXorf30 homolog, partial [Chlamydotis macqueenii]|uniref:putative uncharacterized protein CXorf30 homolog n=1 Tax=Chlamydotis macqueenii TaxID=187382 RepID=UPI0005299B54